MTTGAMDPEVLHHFHESVGQKADVDLYLRLFRAQEKEHKRSPTEFRL